MSILINILGIIIISALLYYLVDLLNRIQNDTILIKRKIDILFEKIKSNDEDKND